MRIAMALAVLVGFGASARAGQPCAARGTVQQAVVVNPSVNTIVMPFAVPVAVPVATFRVPSVLYAYGPSISGSFVEQAANAAPSAVPITPAEAALRARCLACHRGASAKGGLMIFDDAGRLRPRLPRHVIWDMIAQGKMPPASAPEISEEERHAIEDWARLPRDFEW